MALTGLMLLLLAGVGGNPVKYITTTDFSYTLPTTPETGKNIYVVSFNYSSWMQKQVTYSFESSWKVISASAVLIEGNPSFTVGGTNHLLFSDGYYSSESVDEQFVIDEGFFATPTVGYFAYSYGLGIHYFNGTVYKLLKPDLYGQILTLNETGGRKCVFISSPAFFWRFSCFNLVSDSLICWRDIIIRDVTD